jgi:hypothetical protein
MSAVAVRRTGRILLSREARLKRAAEHSLFGLIPLVVTGALILFQFHLNAVAVDFHVAYWPAAHRLINGFSPYTVTPSQIRSGTAFVYPVLSALVFAPFALLSRNLAEVIYMLLCLACVPATLRALNVRDWRIYGVVLLWSPVFVAWQSGNVTLPLALMVALVWRFRERPWAAGLLTATAVSLKPFVWPLGLWLLATRRWKAAAWSLAGAVVINLVAWALCGYSEIHTYLHLSSAVTNALWRGGYSMLAVGHHLGFGRGAGELLLVAISAAATAGVIYLGAWKHCEREALAVTVLLMLVASPLLWSHYFALLLVPLALSRPRLRPVWALPLLMWPIPPRQPVFGWEEVLAWGVTATVMAVVLRAWRYPVPR